MNALDDAWTFLLMMNECKKKSIFFFFSTEKLFIIYLFA